MIRYEKKEKRALAVYASIFLLLVLGIAVGGHFSYKNFEREFRRQAEKQVSAIAELKVNELAAWRRERLIDAQSFYHNVVFSDLVERYFENPADLEIQNQIISRLEYYHSYVGYERLFLLDIAGTYRLVVPAAPGKLEQADTQLMTEASTSMRLDQVMFLDFQREKNTVDGLYISILIPVFAEQSNGHPLGVLALSINPQTYLYPYIQNWPIPSDTAETLLVRRDGEDVLFLNELRFEKNTALNLRQPLTDTDIPAVKAVLGQTGVVEGTDYRGEPVLADVRPVPDSPWFLVSKVDIDEVYAPLRERLWQTLLIVGLAILVAGVGLVTVWRQQRILAYRAKAEVTEALRDSEEKFRKAFILSPDSININRLQDGMFVSINDGFTKITGYAPDEVIGKTSLEMDIWADPQDRKKLMEGLTENGEVENLETRFRMKNGEVRYGLMSASMLELDGTSHIISITRDISDRKLADEKLRQAQLVLENSPVVLFRWKAAAGWPVELVSENIAQFGYTPEEFLSGAVLYASIIHPDDLERVGREVSEYSANGVDRFQQEYRIVTKDGQVRWTDDQTMIERDAQGNIMHYQGTVMDITERKQAEEALRQSEESLSTTLHSIGDGVISTDKNGLIVNMNPVAEKYCGWTLADAKGKPLARVFNIINAETRERVENPVVRVMESGQIAGLANHTVLISKTGREYQIADSAAPIKNKNGETTGVVLVFSDVTEKYKAEQILRESEENFADIFQTVSEGIAYTTLGGQVLSINKSLEKILEIPQEQIVGKNILSLAKDLLSAENIKKTVPVLVSLIQGREIQPFEVEYKTKILEITATINRASGRLTGVVRDTTERRQAEEAQRAAEARYRALVEQIPAITYIDQADGSGRSSFVSPQIQLMLDVSPEDWMQADAVEWGRIIHPEDSSRVLAAYRRTVETGQPFNEEYRIFRPDGRLVWVDDHAVRLDDASGQPSGIHGVMFDITERKQAEEEFSRQTTLFRNLFQGSPEAIAIVDQEDRILNVNRSFENLFGYFEAETQGHYVNDLLVSQPYLEEARGINQISLGDGQVVEREVVRHTKDGSLVNVSLIGYPVFLKQRPIGGFAIYRDITGRKRAEEALRASEEKMSSIFRVAPTGIGVVRDRILVEVNPRISEITGYTKEELTGQSARIFYPTQEEFEWVGKEKYKQIAEKGSGVVETHWQKKDGSTIDVLLASTPIDLADLSKGVTFTALDITERKRAEEALKENEAIFSSFLEHSPVYVFFKDKDIRSLMLSKNYEQMLGMPISDLLGKTMDDLFPSDLAKNMVADDLQVLNEGRRVTVEEEFNGHVYETTKFPVIKDGKPYILAGFTVDITERKQAEEALRESEERLRLAVSAGRMGTWDRNFLTGQLNWSVECKAMFGLSPEIEMNDERFTHALHPEDRAPTDLAIREALEKQTDFDTEYRVIWPDGTIHWIAAQGRGYYNEAGQAIHMAGITSDITERKQAEEALRENQKFLALILDTMPGFLFWKDRNSTYLGCNSRFAEAAGLNQPSEIFGKSDYELAWLKEEADSFVKDDREVMESDTPKHHIIEPQLQADGKHAWLDTSKVPLHDIQGNVVGVLGVFEDITERKQAEEALRESRSLFRSLVESLPQNIFSKDLDGRFTFANQNYCATEGKTLEEILGKTDFDLHPADLAQQYCADDRHVIETGQVLEKVEVHQPLGGERSYVQVTKALIHNGEGQVKGMLGIFWDVTDRKRAEETLRITLAKYKTLFECFPLGITIADRAGNILETNPIAEKLLGLSQDEFVQRGIDSPEWRIVRPDGTPMPSEEFASTRALKEKRVVENVEMGVLRPDNNITWLSVTAAPLPLEEHGVVITYGDITERKQAEEALLESEERFRTLYDNATIGLYRTTPDGRILMLNPAGLRMLGFDSFDEVAGLNLEQNRYNLDYSRKEFREKLESQGVVIGWENGWIRKDGSAIFVRESAKIFRDENGKVVYYDGSFEDVSARVQAEAALKESEELYRKMNQNSPLGMHFYKLSDDDQLIFVGANPAADKLLGVDNSQFIGKTIDEAFPPLMQTEVPQRYRDAAANGTPWSTEQIAYEDGQIRGAFEVKAFQTTPGNMVAVFADITARKKAEEAMRESEEMFRIAFDNAPTGMSLISSKGFAYLAVNPLLCEMFGYTREEFLGETVKLVTHPDDVERSNEWIRKKYNDEPCESDFEKRYIHKDGHIVWGLVRAQWIRNADGSPRMAISHILDITKRKQAEEALRESEALYRQAIEVSNAVPYRQSYDVDGQTVRYDFISEGIRQITGYGPEEFDEPLWDSLTEERFLLEELAEYSFNEAIERVRSGVSPVWKCEHRIRARDGSIHWVFEAAVELRDQNGISQGSIGLFQDITARKQVEEEIRQLNLLLEQRVVERTAQLETTNKELEAFSYSVSHDLRAPLRGIDGWSQALLEDYHEKLDEQGRLYIERVRSETQRMGHLIDDMLKLSRLTRAEMVKEQVELSALAQTIIERLKRDDPQRQVDFDIQAGVIAEGDSHLLEVVLVNLLGNAFKFTAKRADARIEFGQTEMQGQRVFFVRDNGAGFDMSYAQKLFGAFQRMHKVSEFPGNGVGLATVQRIIHRHGGRVWAEAEVGHGAAFYFTLG